MILTLTPLSLDSGQHSGGSSTPHGGQLRSKNPSGFGKVEGKNMVIESLPASEIPIQRPWNHEISIIFLMCLSTAKDYDYVIKAKARNFLVTS